MEKEYSECLQLAAQAWCQPETENIIMIPELAEAFANILLKERNHGVV